MIKLLAICMEDPEVMLGGMGRHVKELYRAIAARGDVEVDVLTMGPGEGAKPYFGFTKHQSDKLVCYKPQHAGMSSILISDIQMLRTALKLVAEGKRWDLIHVHEWNSYQVARALRDGLKIPLVGTMHLCISRLTMNGKEDPSKPWVPPPEDTVYLMQQEGHLIVDTDELILCSKAYARMARELFMVERKINVIYNGIRTDEWHHGAGDPARARETFKLPDRPMALFVGRVAEMKGIVPLLDAIETKDSGYCVVISGEVNANSEEDRENWEVTKRIRLLTKGVPERLRWVGFQQDQTLKDLYSAATVGLMPSTHEPFGIVALEHMAMGVPLIATEVDGLGEIVVDDAGAEYAMIIKPGSSADILEALETLKDPAPRAELTQLGLKRSGDFSWDDIASRTVGVYQELLGRTKHVSIAEPAIQSGPA